jgi:hypothetical protein
MQCEQKFWIVTASADHAANGMAQGIVQACHGKVTPLRRMQQGDGVVIYSSKTAFRDGAPLSAFTAIGHVSGEVPYAYDMGGGFTPWRRGVAWRPAVDPLPIRPMLEDLELTRGKRNWAMPFRWGIVEISYADFSVIVAAMV